MSVPSTSVVRSATAAVIVSDSCGRRKERTAARPPGMRTTRVPTETAASDQTVSGRSDPTARPRNPGQLGERRLSAAPSPDLRRHSAEAELLDRVRRGALENRGRRRGPWRRLLDLDPRLPDLLGQLGLQRVEIDRQVHVIGAPGGGAVAPVRRDGEEDEDERQRRAVPDRQAPADRAAGSRGLLAHVLDEIALAPARPEERSVLASLGGVELLPQPPDVHLDEIRERVEVLVPDVLRDLAARNDAAAVEEQVFEKRVLLGGQLDRRGRAPPPGACSGRGGCCRPSARSAAAASAGAGAPRRARGARPRRTVWPCSRRPRSRGRGRGPTISERAESMRIGVSRIARRISVQTEKPSRPGSRMSRTNRSYPPKRARSHRVQAVAGDIDGIPGLAQRAREETGHPRIVLDHEDAHRRGIIASIARRSAACPLQQRAELFSGSSFSLAAPLPRYRGWVRLRRASDEKRRASKPRGTSAVSLVECLQGRSAGRRPGACGQGGSRNDLAWQGSDRSSPSPPSSRSGARLELGGGGPGRQALRLPARAAFPATARCTTRRASAPTAA